MTIEPDPLTKHDAAEEFTSGIVCDCPTCLNCAGAWGRLLSQLRYLYVERDELRKERNALRIEAEKLWRLEAGGVDSWEGYDYAMNLEDEP